MISTLVSTVFLCLLITACSLSGHSENAIQTAIAFTQNAASNTAKNTENTTEPQQIVPTKQFDGFDNKAPGIAWSANLVYYEGDYFSSLIDKNPLLSSGSYAIYNDKIYVESQEGQIQALNLSNGKKLWSAEGSHIIGADENNLYLRPSPLRLEAIDANSGTLQWRTLFDFAGGELTSQLVVAEKSVIVTINTISRKYFGIVDKTNGEIFWVEPGLPIALQSNILIVEQLEEYEPYIHGITTDTDIPYTVYWGIPTPQHPLMYCDNTLFYQYYDDTQQSSKLIALNPLTGTSLWETQNIPGGISIICYPDSLYSLADTWIDPQHHNIYLRGRTFLVGIDPQTGDIRWSGNIELKDEIVEGGGGTYEFLGESGNLVIYSNAGFGITQAYDAITHDLVWENSKLVLNEVYGHIDSVLVGGIRQRGQHLTYFGLDEKTGAKLWEDQSLDEFGSPTIILNKIIDETDGILKFIDPLSGADTFVNVSGHPYSYIPIADGILFFTEGSVSLLKP